MFAALWAALPTSSFWQLHLHWLLFLPPCYTNPHLFKFFPSLTPLFKASSSRKSFLGLSLLQFGVPFYLVSQKWRTLLFVYFWIIKNICPLCTIRSRRIKPVFLAFWCELPTPSIVYIAVGSTLLHMGLGSVILINKHKQLLSNEFVTNAWSSTFTPP